MRPAALAIIPLFAGFLFAQDRNQTTRVTTETKTTWNGTLVDAACQNTRTERRETREVDATRTTTTKTETTHIDTADCPVTVATSTFGLITSDGRLIRFDNPSNTRVVEIVRTNQSLNRSLGSRTPLKVRVIGTANGDVAVVESLSPEVAAVEAVGDAERLAEPSETIFEARYHDDNGRLVVTARGINFEDLSDAKHSHSWTYAQIKELNRDGNQIKINPYSGDDFEFRVQKAMSDAVYKMIGDRIAAARSR